MAMYSASAVRYIAPLLGIWEVRILWTITNYGEVVGGAVAGRAFLIVLMRVFREPMYIYLRCRSFRPTFRRIDRGAAGVADSVGEIADAAFDPGDS